MDTFFGPYFHFCLGAQIWVKGFLYSLCGFILSLWVHDVNHTHSLATFQWSELFDQRMLGQTEKCLQIQKWWHHKGREVASVPFVLRRWEMDQSMPTKAQFCRSTELPCAQNMQTTSPILHFFCWHKTYLPNTLCQLITCSQSKMTS